MTVFCTDSEAETLRAMEDPNLVVETDRSTARAWPPSRS